MNVKLFNVEMENGLYNLKHAMMVTLITMMDATINAILNQILSVFKWINYHQEHHPVNSTKT